MRRKGVLICFMGIDGSGKTTISNKIIKKMEKSNFRYVWCKFGQNGKIAQYFLNFLNFLVIKKDNGKKEMEDFEGKKELKDNFLSKIYLYFLLFKYNLEIIRKITIPLYLGINIISDRYSTDSLVDIVLEFHYDYKNAQKFLKRLYFVPEPDINFYIQILPQTAFERKRENNIEYLTRKKSIYDKYSEENQIKIINGNDNLKSITNEIISLIQSRC